MNSFILREIVTIFIFISIDEESETWPSLLQCHSTPFFLTTFQNRSIVNLQCYVSFRGTANWFSYTYTYCFHILFLYRLLQYIDYSSLRYTVGPCCFSTLYIVVYICLSQTHSFSLCPPSTPSFSFINHKFVFYFCFIKQFISIILLDSTYSVIYDICLSMSLNSYMKEPCFKIILSDYYPRSHNLEGDGGPQRSRDTHNTY